MAYQVHTLRLAPQRESFFCPYTRLHLFRGGPLEGIIPLEANLEHIWRAVQSGGLIDVNGTVTAIMKKPGSVVETEVLFPPTEETVEAEVIATTTEEVIPADPVSEDTVVTESKTRKKRGSK